MDQAYHKSVTPTDTTTRALRPYEYVVRPPIARLLIAIRQHCGIGGTIQPGVRQLASWMNYASAGRIAPLLQQLALDGWILYDGSSGCITLLADTEVAITERDHSDDEVITERDQLDDEVITPRDQDVSITERDRAPRRPSALLTAITRRDRSTPRMEDHVLAAADQSHDSAAANINHVPCAADSITPRDRLPPLDAALYDLGADDPTLRAEILETHPELTLDALASQWLLAQDRERSGYTPNARALLFGTLRKPGGWLHGRATSGAVDWGAYAAPDDEPPAETLRDRVLRITPEDISGLDFQFVLMRLGMGDTDVEALAALAERTRRAAQRGAA